MHPNYDQTYFAPILAIEDRHFWFHGRNQVLGPLARQVTSDLPVGYRVLEIGCGTGNALRILKEACPGGTVVGMDLFAEGLRYARDRTSCPLVQGDLYSPPFGANFDVIALLDVLEHLPDDVAVLRHVCGMLAPGGVLLLTVPAHPSLWSYFDEAAYHCRRYTSAELRLKLVIAGYRIEYVTQYMATLFPLVWFQRRLLRRRVGDANRAHDLVMRDLRVIPVVNRVLAWLLAQEARLVRRRRALPLGTSLLSIARKGV